MDKNFLEKKIEGVVCENIRANRCKIAPSNEFRDYIASKKRYFHGLKLYIIASNKSYIKEFLNTPGSVHDIRRRKDKLNTAKKRI